VVIVFNGFQHEHTTRNGQHSTKVNQSTAMNQKVVKS